ncbi:probable transcription factor PosF21 isoform X2 [Tripterygium wilfordii]|uniref:probable transcription factor PosF21 isoform X2 n=2 Tax=Tripterygium wilfordii TaxID=458696 RepID=UPI0018F8083F|nr:probable transcription factor PosF21 isoform X2 [Tripterygium wilfordii]
MIFLQSHRLMSRGGACLLRLVLLLYERHLWVIQRWIRTKPQTMVQAVHPLQASTTGFLLLEALLIGMLDNPLENLGHRRAHSEILSLPDDLGFDSGLGVVGGAEPLLSDETEEDWLSTFLDMDTVNSSCFTSGIQIGESPAAATGQVPPVGAGTSSMEAFAGGSCEGPRVRHQHSQSMDGSMTIKPKMLISGSEEPAVFETRKFLSAEKLAELALIDPKRAKRISANRQSAARSKERKTRHIVELERKLDTLQTKATSLTTQLTLLQRDTNGLTSEIGELKLRLETMEQQEHLHDELNDALKEEMQHLKLLTGQAMANFDSYGADQQFHPNKNAMHTLLTTDQLQQLKLRPQKQQHQLQLLQPYQMHQLQQQQKAGNVKVKGSTPPPGQKDKTSDA